MEELDSLQEYGEMARLAVEGTVLYPEEMIYHLRLAIALDGLGRKEEARAPARRALEIDPDNEAARCFLESE